jgi:hypothetical protein
VDKSIIKETKKINVVCELCNENMQVEDVEHIMYEIKIFLVCKCGFEKSYKKNMKTIRFEI